MALTAVADVVSKLIGRRASSIESLKAMDGRLGGVDPQTDVYRLVFAPGDTAVLKTFEDPRTCIEERRNLEFLGGNAPGLGPVLLAASEAALLMQDLGPDTVATISQAQPEKGRDAWRLWADSLARVHAAARTRLDDLRQLYAPEGPRVETAPSAAEMLAVLEKLIELTGRRVLEPGESADLASCLRELEARLRAREATSLVFGFHDANPMNAIVFDGRVCFVDVGGPALGLVSRAFGQVWRAPRPDDVIGAYIEARWRHGWPIDGAEFREERRLFEVTSSVSWLGRHLEAASGGGIPDIDGVQHGYAEAESFNLAILRDLTAEEDRLAPLEKLVVRLSDEAARPDWPEGTPSLAEPQQS